MFQRIYDRFQEKRRIVDPDQSAKEQINHLLDASCKVNGAIAGALDNDFSAFARSLDDAGKIFRQVSDTLSNKENTEKFNKSHKMIIRLPIVPEELRTVNTYGDILTVIGVLAKQSADAIDKLRRNEGGDEDLSLVAGNSAEITRLVLEFYGLNV